LRNRNGNPVRLRFGKSGRTGAVGLGYSRQSGDSACNRSRGTLVVPPDFALEPTPAVAARPTEAGQEQVLEAMFGGAAQRSAAERAISTTPGAAEMGIRSSVGDPQTNTVNKGSITRDIIAAPEGDGQTAQAVIPG
jgi:hypothetical protein